MLRHSMVWRSVRPAAVLLLLLAGCQDVDWGGLGRKKPPPEPAPLPRENVIRDTVAAGTIGEQTLLTNVDAEPLRGFGVVVGLNGNGSRDCPTSIREFLLDFLAKQVDPGNPGRNPSRPSPAQLLDSLDTAVVEVRGVVPAGAPAGARFDLQVRAIPGTSTVSLAGGLLLPTPLRFFDPDISGTGMLAGPMLAEGGGPVFVNPFAEADRGESEADPRRGAVLGGGRAVEGRRSRLTLLEPSYRLAQAIERRVNERFGQRPKTATAMSRGYVDLTTPPQYAQRPALFRRLVAHLYLDRRPAAQEQKLRELVRLALSADPPLENISFAWEAFGSSVVAHIQGLYTHAVPQVRFYAARAGLRVGDITALEVLADLANAGPHALRLLAIRELGACASPQAAIRLAPLLNDADQEIRIATYEALLQHGHPAVKSTRFPFLLDRGQVNFCLDVVESDGPPLIYVRRSRFPRIAVFGSRMALMPPVFYVHPEDSLTVHTVAGSDDVQLFMKRRGRLSEQLLVPARVVDVVTALADLPIADSTGHLRGMGLPYSRVIQVLVALCRNETIPATVVFEKATMTDLLGPETFPERRESDADAEPWEEPAPAREDGAAAGIQPEQDTP